MGDPNTQKSLPSDSLTIHEATDSDTKRGRIFCQSMQLEYCHIRSNAESLPWKRFKDVNSVAISVIFLLFLPWCIWLFHHPALILWNISITSTKSAKYLSKLLRKSMYNSRPSLINPSLPGRYPHLSNSILPVYIWTKITQLSSVSLCRTWKGSL